MVLLHRISATASTDKPSSCHKRCVSSLDNGNRGRWASLSGAGRAGQQASRSGPHWRSGQTKYDSGSTAMFDLLTQQRKSPKAGHVARTTAQRVGWVEMGQMQTEATTCDRSVASARMKATCVSSRARHKKSDARALSYPLRDVMQQKKTAKGAPPNQRQGQNKENGGDGLHPNQNKQSQK